MWKTAAGTLASKGLDLRQRCKRNRDGSLVPVPFISGRITDCTLSPVSWYDLSQALVAMTEYAFSDIGAVHEWDSLSNSWVQEKFHWGFEHNSLFVAVCP